MKTSKRAEPATLTKTVNIRYFAALREAAGRTHESVATDSETAGALFESLREKYGFKLGVEDIGVSANAAFESPRYALKDGDEIVFIPPVSGG